jgi:hypothetical protein
VWLEKQSDHTHTGNVATALARKAVSGMMEKMNELTATPSTAQSAVAAGIEDHVLMALPRRSLVTRTLHRRKQQINTVANGGVLLPAIPMDLMFDIPPQFAALILFDSGPAITARF